MKDITSLNTIRWVKISFELPFTPKNAGFVEIVRSKGDENQATVAVMEMRNRQQSRRNGHEKQATVVVMETRNRQ